MIRVPAFFYGSYMDPEILRRYGAHPGAGQRATLRGWRVGFTPHANLIASQPDQVSGMLYELPHAELDLLYGPKGFVTTYKPVPVLVEAEHGSGPALTYVEDAAERPPDPVYLENYIAVCRRVGLPKAFIEQLVRQTTPSRGSP